MFLVGYIALVQDSNLSYVAALAEMPFPERLAAHECFRRRTRTTNKLKLRTIECQTSGVVWGFKGLRSNQCASNVGLLSVKYFFEPIDYFGWFGLFQEHFVDDYSGR